MRAHASREHADRTVRNPICTDIDRLAALLHVSSRAAPDLGKPGLRRRLLAQSRQTRTSCPRRPCGA